MEGVTQPPALWHPKIADHPDPTSPQVGPSQTLVMEARQLGDFCSFSGCVVAGSGIARKLNGGPMLVVPMWPGLRAGFCRRLLSTMLEVLDAKLSRVLKNWWRREMSNLRERRDKIQIVIKVYEERNTNLDHFTVYTVHHCTRHQKKKPYSLSLT